MVVLGLCAVEDPWRPTTALFKEARIAFSYLYSRDEFRMCLETIATRPSEVRHLVTDRISLDALPTTFEALRTRSTQCKVLVDPRIA